MPYIEKDRREPLRGMVDELVKNCAEDSMKAATCCAAISLLIAPPQIIAAGLNALIDTLRERTNNDDPEAGRKVAGDINYCISRLIFKFLNMGEMSYSRCILGKETILVHAESIVARIQTPNRVPAFSTLRVVARHLDARFGEPYEAVKMAENGDFTE